MLVAAGAVGNPGFEIQSSPASGLMLSSTHTKLVGVPGGGDRAMGVSRAVTDVPSRRGEQVAGLPVDVHDVCPATFARLRRTTALGTSRSPHESLIPTYGETALARVTGDGAGELVADALCVGLDLPRASGSAKIGRSGG